MFAKLPRGMIGNDSGQPWMLYWLSNALEVTNQHQLKLKPDQKARCCSYLRQCHNSQEGGFSGQPGIQTHVASTYAAMMAIVNIGTKEAYDIIDRPKMKAYLNGIKNNLDTTHNQSDPNNVWIFKEQDSGEQYDHKGTANVLGTLPGSMPIHANGEMDMRGLYCALVTADILNLIEGNDELTRGMGDFIASC